MNDEIARMKQVENYKSKYVPRSFSDTKDSPDSYWKYAQKRSQSFPVGRRNPETEASYYSSSTTYKPQRSHACSSPTYSKCASIHAPEAVHHAQGHCKPNRDKHYPSTFSTGRKIRYDEELGNNEKLKYIHEESENFTEDNAEEDADEEAEEEHEEAGEFLDKDYEGQEGDDETEEEFLTSHRGQGVSKKDTLKQQRWRTVEQEPRRFRCQQHVDLAFAGHASSPRYYHNMAEHEVPEPLSDEDFVLTSLKSPTRRSPTDYHRWSKDRYDDDSLPVQSPRRARTKPEMDQLIDAEMRRTRRCNRCGSVANRKDELPKDGYRFDDRVNPTKGPIGDEAEGQTCLRRNAKDFDLSLYSAKPRKPRDTKSPLAYEVPEHMDKFCDYSRYSSRYQRKVESYPEKMKRMLHGTARVTPRYVE